MKTLMENQLSWLALFMTALYSREYLFSLFHVSRISSLDSPRMIVSYNETGDRRFRSIILLYYGVTDLALSVAFRNFIFLLISPSPKIQLNLLRLQETQVKRACFIEVDSQRAS